MKDTCLGFVKRLRTATYCRSTSLRALSAAYRVAFLRNTLSSAQGSLRTKQTIEKFKAVPVQPGTTSPLLVYFGTLLTRGKLNAFESVELSRLVLSQNKKHLLDNWFKARLLPLKPCFCPLDGITSL